MLLARLPAPLKPAAMLLVQPSLDTDDAEQSSYEHDAQQSVGAVRESVERARRRRADHYRACGAPAALCAARSSRTLGDQRRRDILSHAQEEPISTKQRGNTRAFLPRRA